MTSLTISCPKELRCQPAVAIIVGPNGLVVPCLHCLCRERCRNAASEIERIGAAESGLIISAYDGDRLIDTATRAEWIADNDEAEDLVEELRALRPGASFEFGGGAAPLTRFVATEKNA